MQCKKCGLEVEKTRYGKCKACVIEAEDYKELYAYLKKGFGVSLLSGKILKQIKSFKAKGFTYREIMYCVYYMTNIKGKTLQKDSIALIDYYRSEAMEHHRITEIAKQNTEVIEIPTTVRVIRRKLNRGTTFNDTKKLVDMESIV